MAVAKQRLLNHKLEGFRHQRRFHLIGHHLEREGHSVAVFPRVFTQFQQFDHKPKRILFGRRRVAVLSEMVEKKLDCLFRLL